MNAAILRRRKLGRGSCNGISSYLSNELGRDTLVIRSDKQERYDRDYDILFRWGCTAESLGNRRFTINTSEMIHAVNDKVGCRKKLEHLSPLTHFSKNSLINDPSSFDNNSMWIGRPASHSQGRNAVFCRSIEDVMNDQTSAYWSLFIPKQKEYRIYCFMGKVLCVAEKVPTDPTAVLWNKAQNGSSFVNVKWSDWPMDSIESALIAQNIIGIDFAGIDVMEYNGQAYVLELNSAPTLSSVYRQQCFAKAFNWLIDSIETFGQKPTHNREQITNWKSVIHPCIKEF